MSVDETTARLDRLADRRPKSEITEDSLALSLCASEPLLRYVAIWNRWMAWDKTVWREDSTLAVYDRIRAHVRQETGADKEWMKANAISAIERLAKSDRRYAATSEQWDQDDWLLSTPGGIVDLRTGDIRYCDPESYLTKSAICAPDAVAPEAWLGFLKEVTGDDEAFVAFLQRVVGYCLTGSTREHALFFLYGPGGNGKGTFLNTLQRVLGDYAKVASMETFTESNVDRHPTDLAMLRGARLVLAQETEEGRAWAESRIKALTGGDPVTARYMRQDFFTFVPKFKLLIAGNHKPRLRNVDEAFRRRLYLLPFTRTFRGDARDPDLAQKLLAEAGGILGWAIEGALAYQREGLNPPRAVTDATAEYFAGENLFEQWLEECCDLSPEHWERPTALFNSWKRFAETSNERAGRQNEFAQRLDTFKELDKRRSGSRGRYWQGLKLKPSEMPETPW